MDAIVWVVIGFASGSVPWAILIGKVFGRTDVRSIGDGNPGAANAWKLAGWQAGMTTLALDIGKSAVPVYIASQYMQPPSGITSQIGLAAIAVSPIVGHAWSPFLHLSGGKALASTWGSWIALTGGLALPVGCILLGLFHSLQKNHAITVTLCVIGFLAVFMPFIMQPYIAIFCAANLAIVMYKHRNQYSSGIEFRDWIPGRERRSG
jgi:glycerol-3-phosphate acyltransferase PlsY